MNRLNDSPQQGQRYSSIQKTEFSSLRSGEVSERPQHGQLTIGLHFLQKKATYRIKTCVVTGVRQQRNKNGEKSSA
jgi:hypothetical protein